MNSCNMRGFMVASGSKVCKTNNCKSTLTRGDGGFVFFFNEAFDTFQNGYFDVGNGKDYEVYLKNDHKNISVYLGTTSYRIFPNTAIPLSFPFFTFMMKESYLFIKTGDDYPVITLAFEGGGLHKDLKANQPENEYHYNYHSIYEFQSSEMYNYENQTIHKPIITTIIYSE